MRKLKIAVVVLTALNTFLLVSAIPAKAHQTGPYTQRYGRAWVTPNGKEVKVNIVRKLQTERARVLYRRTVSVEWNCPDGSSRWTAERRVVTKIFGRGPWKWGGVVTAFGGVPPNPGGCATTGKAQVKLLHSHSVAL